MLSKTLCFNPTLFRKNLTRFWPLWGGASLLGALAPLSFLMYFIQTRPYDIHITPQEMTLIFYSALSYFVPVLSLFYAALCALAVWHFLYNARSVSLYHALPITRKGLFATNFLSGMAMMLIPYAVAGLLTLAVALAAGCLDPAGLLVTILGVLGLSLFYFASASFVVFVTGNSFAFTAFYFLFHFLAAGAEWLVSILMTHFYFGVTYGYAGVVEFLSPTLYLLRKVSPGETYTVQPTADGWADSVLESVLLENGFLIAVYALAGLVLLGAAWLLYQRRRSESAGDVVAVGWMQPIFRYGVSICAAASGGLILYNILFDSFQTNSTAALLPMAVSMAIAGLIGFYIASMLLVKSFKVFRANWKGALASVLAAAALCGIIALDPAGVESWVPAPEAVQSVGFSLSSPYGYGISVNVSDPETVEKILALHRAILAEQTHLDANRERYCHVSLDYWSSQTDSTWRFYGLNYDTADLTQSDAIRRLTELSTDPVIQEANIYSSIQGEDARLTGGYIENLYNQETQEFEGLDLTLDQARALDAAIRRDIQAGHFGKTLFLENPEETPAFACRGRIQLYYTITRTYPNQPADTYSDGASLTLSTFCTETLQALKDMGVLSGPYSLLTEAEYRHLRENGTLPDGSFYHSYGDGDYYDDYYYDYEYASWDSPNSYSSSVRAEAVPISAGRIG